VLAELRGDRVIVGIGINLTWAPPGAAMLGAGTDRDALLDRLVAELQRWFAAPDAQVLAGWRERAETLGRTVRVELPGESFEGLAEDVAVDGSLIVSGRLVAAGDVIHVR
jgi:BirA family biotin operon repressor/biotin-[acetyl-CoA-carboxylase] ligase